MARVLQLLLVICMAAAVFCTVEQESAEASAIDVLDAGFYGMEDTDRDTEAVDPSVVDSEVETEDAAVLADAADGTTTGPDVDRSRHGRRHHRRGPHRHHGRRHHGRRPRGQWTAEEKLNHVCSALNSSTNSRRERRMSQKLANLTPEKRESLMTVLEARKTEMKRCCLLSDAERTQCTEQMSNDRYDRVCNDEEALCVWAAVFKRNQADTTPSPTKERCCALQGSERYQCFATARSTAHSDRYSRRNRSG